MARDLTRLSWGRFPVRRQRLRAVSWLDQLQPISCNRQSILPYGHGRSYGDLCLNSSGELIDMRALSRFVTFDRASGLLTAQAGVTLREILELVVPAGWFLPVTPGTSLVTLGGAIASDVHGKNHHCAGTFGCHVRSLRLLRNAEEYHLTDSPADQQYKLFCATIGGLGLTGVITEATIQLLPIESARITGESIRFESLDEFFEISAESDAQSDYTVAWLDCLGGGEPRGHFMRGNHAAKDSSGDHSLGSWTPKWERARVPCDAPAGLVCPLTMNLFNFAYYNRQRSRVKNLDQPFEPFFYPLDIVHEWNRLYGPAGFFQFQCVVPHAHGEPGIRAVVDAARASAAGSFLAVLKEFGSITSPGLLSFPRAGFTLCLDFAYQGAATIELMKRLESITLEHGGALYPAKDALMSPETFQKSFPRLQEFIPHVLPNHSSDFWRRVAAVG